MYTYLKSVIPVSEPAISRGVTWDEIVRLYRLKMKGPPHNLPPRYNICPTDPVDVVTERYGSRDFVRMRWGLVPSWWPKPLKELKAATFNARAETVAEKPFFRDAFRRARCLIPATGYYEWQNRLLGRKQIGRRLLFAAASHDHVPVSKRRAVPPPNDKSIYSQARILPAPFESPKFRFSSPSRSAKSPPSS
jgi:hypothetical protein